MVLHACAMESKNSNDSRNGLRPRCIVFSTLLKGHVSFSQCFSLLFQSHLHDLCPLSSSRNESRTKAAFPQWVAKAMYCIFHVSEGPLFSFPMFSITSIVNFARCLSLRCRYCKCRAIQNHVLLHVRRLSKHMLRAMSRKANRAGDRYFEAFGEASNAATSRPAGGGAVLRCRLAPPPF